MLKVNVLRPRVAARLYATVCFEEGADPFPVPPSHPPLILYGRSTSRVQKPAFMLELLGLDCVRVEMPTPPPAAYKAVNPVGLVPALKVADGAHWTTLTDSNSICVFLAERFGGGSGMMPTGVALGAALQWSAFVEYYLATPRLNPLYHGVVHSRYPPSVGKPGCPPADALQTHEDDSVSALSVLEAHMTGKDFIVGPCMTFADVCTAPWLHRWHEHAARGEYGPRLAPDQFPALARYYQSMASLPAFKATVS